MVLTNQLIYLVNVKPMRKIFFKLCVLLRKSELYLYIGKFTIGAKGFQDRGYGIYLLVVGMTPVFALASIVLYLYIFTVLFR